MAYNNPTNICITTAIHIQGGSVMAEQVLIQFEATLPEHTITRTEAKNAFHELRRQAANVPEMSLDEINAEILAVRAERKKDDKNS